MMLASCDEVEEQEKVTGEVPQYGGTLNILWSSDPRGFDNAYLYSTGTMLLTNEELFQGDWARGPAGTNEVSWRLMSFVGVERYSDKGLAENWEIEVGDETATLVIDVRQGVHFHNKPPTNGRELVADDVVFSIDRTWTNPQSIMGIAYPAPVSITAPDNYTVLVEYASLSDLVQALVQVCDMNEMWPRDAVEANNNDMRDWRASIGTGPFMLTEYIQGSSITLVKNPDYWDTDPVGPGKGNQLPYLDGVKILIIPDVSTQLAAMRTAKTDHGMFNWEDAVALRQSNPELMESKALTTSPYMIFMKVDNPKFPWSNKSVRQALHMAADYQTISDEYYGGNAEVYCYPSYNVIEARDYRVLMDELLESVQELFVYSPDKAKQMLADAGYADGFDMEIVCETKYVDLLSIYKDYWEKIGVNLILAPKERAVYTSTRESRAHDQAIFTNWSGNVPFDMVELNPAHTHNASMVNDARAWEAHDQIWDNYLNWDKQCQIYKEVTPYILENCWMIPSPQPYDYTIWQPWLKNYHGEFSVGNTSKYNWPKWVWIDHDLKEEMVGR